MFYPSEQPSSQKFLEMSVLCFAMTILENRGGFSDYSVLGPLLLIFTVGHVKVAVQVPQTMWLLEVEKSLSFCLQRREGSEVLSRQLAFLSRLPPSSWERSTSLLGKELCSWLL